ncbi:hypothetical protein O3Q51_06100 [Cryomorphaceae bacterium 1068]|nr:hypothetical protein [Cryomorphaceae bacterium 1068]
MIQGNFERNMRYWRWYRTLTFKNVLGLAFLLEGLGVLLLPLSITSCLTEQYLLSYIGFSVLVVLYVAIVLAIIDKLTFSLKLLFAIPIVLVALVYIALSTFILSIEVLPELFNYPSSLRF